MLIVIELFLTVLAWRKGWKGYALLPLGIAVVAGAVIGAGMGGTMPVEDALQAAKVAGVVIDLAATGILIAMTARPRKGAQATVPAR
jgi:hypothetical protein